MKHLNTSRSRIVRRTPPVQVEAMECRRLLSGAGSAGLAQAYGQLPLSFEVNQGQTNSQVQFLSRGAGYSLFLTSTGAVLSLQSPSTDTASTGTGTALRMQLVNANASPKAVGLDPLPGTSNYLTGSDSSQWLTNVPNFARVQEQDVYPGVNLIYYGNQQQLEYDFTVAPGTDPGVIRLSFQGAESTTLDLQGNLILHTAGGDVIEHAPVLYQESGGVRQAVSGHYVQDNNGEIGFSVGAYDASKSLVIDPILSYSTYVNFFGEANFGVGNSLAVDAAGNAYITGQVGSVSNFPTTPGAYQTTYAGQTDAYVMKFNSAGTALVYSTYLGGSGGDGGFVIAIDTAGNAYVAGGTSSNDFPTTPGAIQTHLGRPGNTFLTKLNPTGSAIVYSTFIGGQIYASVTALAVDVSGLAYITGSADAFLPTTPGAFQPTYGGGLGGAYVMKINSNGSSLVYSTYLVGQNAQADYSSSSAIAVDTAGNAYVTGITGSENFPTTPGAFITRHAGGSFVTKLNPSGTALVYSTYLVGTGLAQSQGIAVDATGNAYITGYTSSTNFPTTPGAFQTAYSGGYLNAFVTKLNPTGSALVYSTYLGGTDSDTSAAAIAVDRFGNAYVTGLTQSNFPTTPGAFQTTPGNIVSGNPAIVAILDTTGSALMYSTYLGGNRSNYGKAIALDEAGNAYVLGFTNSTNFLTTPGVIQPTYDGSVLNGIFFLTKFSLGQAVTSVLTASSPNPSTIGQVVTFTETVALAIGSTGTPTGLVTFFDGKTALGAVPLDTTGHASFSTSTLGAGMHRIIAFYSGNAIFSTTSASTTQAISAAPSVTNLIAAPTPSTSSQLVTFTAVVGPTLEGRPSPSGTVFFSIDGVATSPIIVVPSTSTPGQSLATFSTASLSVGTHSIIASYSGDTSTLASTSSVVSQVVDQIVTFSVVNASPNPSPIGQLVSFTATLFQAAGSLGTPTGTFTFLDGTTPLQVVPLDTTGHASYVTSALSVGVHVITAVYSGDANFAISNGNSVQTVPAPVVIAPPIPPVVHKAPNIVGVQRFGSKTQTTILVLTFDQPLDIATAQNPLNYRIASVDGHRINVRFAIYTPATQTVTLFPVHALNTNSRFYLTVTGASPRGIKGADGLPLDGSGKGRPYTNFNTVIDRLPRAVPTIVASHNIHPIAQLAVRHQAPAQRLSHRA